MFHKLGKTLCTIYHILNNIEKNYNYLKKLINIEMNQISIKSVLLIPNNNII